MKKEGLFRKTVLLAGCLLLCQVAGGIGALVTTPSIPGWYAGLVKPSFNPPNWIFGPVWTVLYLLMGAALFLVWKRPKSGERDAAVRWFLAQLALNILWSVLFFGLHQPWPAFVDILLLWSAILIFALRAHPLSRTAAWLTAPYLLWVAFASLLNLSIARLNP